MNVTSKVTFASRGSAFGGAGSGLGDSCVLVDGFAGSWANPMEKAASAKARLAGSAARGQRRGVGGMGFMPISS
jgi:hypothetical protein